MSRNDSKIENINQALDLISAIDAQIKKEIQDRKQKSINWMKKHEAWKKLHMSNA